MAVSVENANRTYEFWITGFARPIIGEIVRIETVPVDSETDTLEIIISDGVKEINVKWSALCAWAPVQLPKAA